MARERNALRIKRNRFGFTQLKTRLAQLGSDGWIHSDSQVGLLDEIAPSCMAIGAVLPSLKPHEHGFGGYAAFQNAYNAA